MALRRSGVRSPSAPPYRQKARLAAGFFVFDSVGRELLIKLDIFFGLLRLTLNRAQTEAAAPFDTAAPDFVLTTP